MRRLARRGFARASILSLPYAMLSDKLAGGKDGRVHEHRNFFIVIPQLVAASVLGELLKRLFHGEPVWALAVGGRQPRCPKGMYVAGAVGGVAINAPRLIDATQEAVVARCRSTRNGGRFRPRAGT